MMALNDFNQPPNEQSTQAIQLSSTYPLAPISYVNSYSDENVKLGKAPPPPPIIKDSYSCFGKLIDPNDALIRSLESQGIKQLYITESTLNDNEESKTNKSNSFSLSTKNHKKELKKLNHSILIAYLDLLEVLVKAPNTQLPKEQQPIDLNTEQQTFKTLRDQKLEDIELLFINMHHLINELRPYQARDNLRCMLEMQKRQRLETANKFKSHLFKIVDLLKLCIESIKPSPSCSSSSSTVDYNLKKSDEFLDELNNLMLNANKLTTSLETLSSKTNNNNTSGVVDAFDSKYSSYNKNKKISSSNDLLNNKYSKSILAESNDIDMLNEDDNTEKNLIKLEKDIHFLVNNNKNQKQLLYRNGLDEYKVGETASAAVSYSNRNCDFKELVLCDIIDEFLLKGNDF